MLLLRFFLLLALGSSFNSIQAFESLENSTPSYFQGKQPLLVAEKQDPRRRGFGCSNPPDVWTVTLCEETSRFCYIDPAKVTLWLPPNKRSLGNNWLRIKNSRSDKSPVSILWTSSVETDTLPWPVDEVPLQSEATYSITVRNLQGYRSYLVTLYEVPGELSEPSEQAMWMMETGCTQQADMLIEKQNNNSSSSFWFQERNDVFSELLSIAQS